MEKHNLIHLLRRAHELIEDIFQKKSKKYEPEFHRNIRHMCKSYQEFSHNATLDKKEQHSRYPIEEAHFRAKYFKLANQLLPPCALELSGLIRYASIVLLEQFFLKKVEKCDKVVESIENYQSLDILKTSIRGICNISPYASSVCEFTPVAFLNLVVNDRVDEFESKCFKQYYVDEKPSETLLVIIATLELELLQLDAKAKKTKNARKR